MWIIVSRLFQWFFLSDRPLKQATIVGGILCVVQIVMLLVASYQDNSLFLPNDDLGTFEHLGIWVIILGDWLVMLAVATIVVQARKMVRRYPVKR